MNPDLSKTRKKIRLKICNADLSDKFSFGNYFLKILNKYYQVELSEEPEYVLYNDSDAEYLNYDCIRILFIGENFSPNFNLCDYAIGFDYLSFGDRFYRMPLYLVAQYYNDEEQALAAELLKQPWQGGDPDFTEQPVFTQADLAKKSGFCSFVYSNYLADPPREEIFQKLSKYKKVDAGGVFLNNIGGRVEHKLSFEAQHKFSVAFENSSRSGYTTEKLTNSLVARTIPIYWGNPDIGKEFNENRFINCHKFKNFDEVVERVKEIDQSDELYLRMINEPVAAPGYDFLAVRQGLDRFLRGVFDQPLALAKRRTINTAKAAALEAGEASIGRQLARKNSVKRTMAKLYQPLKKLGILEKFKQRFFSKQIHGKKDP